MLEKVLESPLNSKEIQPVSPKGNQSWIFIGRADPEAKAPIFCHVIGRKDRDAGKDWRQEKKAVTEDEMAGWHHQIYGHEFEQTPEISKGQGSLACFRPWGHKESDTTKWLNNKNAAWVILVPWAGIELDPTTLEGRFSTTRLPGKSPFTMFISYFLLVQVKNKN